MATEKKWIFLIIILIAVYIDISESRIRARVRVRYTSGYSSSSGGNTLSPGIIAAIIVGCIAGPVILAVCIICCTICCKSKNVRNIQARRVIARSPQAISTIYSVNTQTSSVKNAQTTGQQFTNLPFSMEPKKPIVILYTVRNNKKDDKTRIKSPDAVQN